MTSTTDTNAVLQAVQGMSDEEAAAWMAGGDYSSIGGVAIAAQDAQRIAESLGDPEVAGFGMNFGLNFETPPGPPVDMITHRKAGKGQQEFLVVKMNEVFVS